MGWNNIKAQRILLWETVADFLEKEKDEVEKTIPAEPEQDWLNLSKAITSAAKAMKDAHRNLKTIHTDIKGPHVMGDFKTEKIRFG